MAELVFTNVRDARFHEDVGRQIARWIVRGDLPPGATLPTEAELSGQFGVSRPVVREALRRLGERRLIVVRHGRRTVVAAAADWDILDRLVLEAYREEGLIAPLVGESLRARRMLEPEIAAEAARRADEALVGALLANLERQEATLDQPAAFLEEDAAFHHLLAVANDNRVLIRFVATIRDLLHVSREVTNRLPNALPDALMWHRRVCAAIADGDPDRARAAMAGHLDWTTDRIWQAAETPPAAEPALARGGV